MKRINIKYIDEINSFHDWLITNQISTSARLLWFALMHYCNRTGWKSEFNLAISALELDTGLSKQSIIRGRNVLQQSGRIDVKVRRGNQSAIYKIIPFAFQNGTQSDTQSGRKAILEVDAKRTQSDTHGDTIPRLDKSKTKTRREEEKEEPCDGLKNVLQEYQKNIRPVSSPIEADKLKDMVSHYGDTWTLEAIKRAVMRGKRSLSYIDGILQSWDSNGFDEGDENSGSSRNGIKSVRGKNKSVADSIDWSKEPTDWDD
jgi:DnaD/phage-associated family protein